MAENNLPQPRNVVGLERKREEITAILMECYARDLLGLEEYEHRVTLVNRAATIDELEPLVADVPVDIRALAQRMPAGAAPGKGLQLTVEHSVKRLEGQRLAVGRIDLKARGSVVKLRYDAVADLPAEIVIHAELIGTVLKIVVPPEYAVSDETETKGSVVKCRRSWFHRGIQTTGRLRITGTAQGSVVKVKTRRRRFR